MVDSKRIHVLQHSLGLNRYGQGESYRNYYVAGAGHHSMPTLEALVSEGLMHRFVGNAVTGGDDCFKVTDAGRAYVAEHSPKPPKLTRSQRRYEDFLAADCGMRFGEWLKLQGGQRNG